MSYLKERVSYLKGLAEGIQISESSNEGKLFKAIIDVLDDIALAVEDIEEIQDQMSEQVDNIDEDLAEIEKEIFELDEYDDEDDDSCMTEITCPHCNEEVEIDLDMIDDEDSTIECPNCKQKIDIEWDCDCEECGHH